MFCLIPKIAEDFKNKIISGEIDPTKLESMSSAERRKFFADQLGESNAKEVNSLFESKLLLKNKQLGYINFAKQLLGEKHAALHDIISKIERMDKVLNPADEHAFLEDLASKKLGTDITFEEAKHITELSHDMEVAKSKITEDMPDGSPERLEYGAYRQSLKRYTDDLKLSNEDVSLKQTIKENLNPLTLLSNIGGFAKGIWSAFDNSAIGRQGIKVLIDSPKIWGENVIKSFKQTMQQLTDSKESNRVMDGMMADILSRKNAINGNYQRMKIDIGVNEEAYPSTLPEKIPVLGNLYKASEVAYTGFLRMARADLADKFIKMAEDNGMNITDKKVAEGIGQFVNSMTGRGHLGTFEPAAKGINNIFFSAKKVMSDIDFLTGYQFRDIPRQFKIRAAQNIGKVALTVSALAIIANSLRPGTIETDPTSTNFLKVRIGDTYHDFLGGMPGIIVLLSRMILGKKKTMAGNISELNTGKYGSETSSDMFWNWMQNKLSPIGSIIKDFVNRQDFNGNPVTIQGEALKTITPLPLSDYMQVLGSKNPTELKALSIFLNLNGIQGTVVQSTKKPKLKKH